LCYADRRRHNHHLILVFNFLIICISAAVTAWRLDRQQLIIIFFILFILFILFKLIIIGSGQRSQRIIERSALHRQC
jgi:hypothetical protein